MADKEPRGKAAIKAIKAARARGRSTKEIAESANRTPGTIKAIERGEIKNPPQSVLNGIRAA